MAYQTRVRDPLLEAHTQEAIRRRGTELAGLALVGLAVMFGAMLWTYSPDDSGWLSVSSGPVQNLLGSPGAAVASRLILTVGWAAWVLPALLGVWGFRFVLHLGDGRVLSRIVGIPVFAGAAAVFLACNVPPAGWPHGFGLGGLSGDAALGILVDLMPLGLSLSLITLTLATGALFVTAGLFSLGFSRFELYMILRTVLIALILTYASILAFIGVTGRLLGGAAVKVHARQQERKKQREEQKAVERVMQEPVPEPTGPAPDDRPRPLFNLLPKATISLPKLRRKAQPVEEAEEQVDLTAEDPTEARVRARISDAIKARAVGTRVPRGSEIRAEPPVTENIFRDTRHLDDDPEPVEETLIDEADSDTSAAEVSPSLGGASRALDAIPGAVSFKSLRNRIKPAPEAESEPVVKPRRPAADTTSRKAREEAQPNLFADKSGSDYETPPLGLLADPATIVRHHLSNEALEANARMLESVLDDYGVKGDIVSVSPGPVVTMYELEPAPGLKASRVIGLADDIARSMSALSARVSTVPGRSVIGIELPNENRETVLLREILASRDYGDGDQALPLALGKDIGGKSVVANLAKMPHLLIAGTTGSGKSVAINTMILSLLYRLSPDECRLIMIDPKMLELSVYDGIPHLLSPVVTDPKKAVVALKWVVGEMEERYRKMSKMGVRNIHGYNARVEAALKKGEDFTRTVQTGFDDDTGEPVFETETFTPEKMPFIVVIVDEMADLMMVAGKEIEACIQRLAQMARASGIHLIMATQRPSVDVITGTIKANFPTRISFQVTSKIDSRTILGEMGAEQLLGMGDMLYMAGGGKITRIHAPFASDEEVEEVVNNLKSYGPPEYVGGVVEGPSEDKSDNIDQVLGLGGNTNGEDALYDQAVAIVAKDRKCSTSYIQRKLAIGYNKAARLVEQMEDEGVVSEANHVGKREVLVPERQ